MEAERVIKVFFDNTCDYVYIHKIYQIFSRIFVLVHLGEKVALNVIYGL